MLNMQYDLVTMLVLPKCEYALEIQDEREQLTQQCEKVIEAAFKWVTRAKNPKMVRREIAALGLEDAMVRRWKACKALRDILEAAILP